MRAMNVFDQSSVDPSRNSFFQSPLFMKVLQRYEETHHTRKSTTEYRLTPVEGSGIIVVEGTLAGLTTELKYWSRITPTLKDLIKQHEIERFRQDNASIEDIMAHHEIYLHEEFLHFQGLRPYGLNFDLTEVLGEQKSEIINPDRVLVNAYKEMYNLSVAEIKQYLFPH